MSDEIKNVFISHVHKDDSKLSDMKDLLSKHGCTMRDSSINSDKPNNAKSPDYIKSEILAPQIKWAGAMVVLISPDTHKSEWVNWEIDYAVKQGMPIVGVWCPGATDSDLPTSFQQLGNSLVGWQGQRILDAINGDLENWETPEGELRPYQPTPRAEC
ncbi:MAG: hypothetical protein COB46_13755 [Rhodospirillaceae bacterium]|nr:MAG: hypothetical protein COB46_13755 [Rhodospirillaceae bacterium]